MIERFAASVRQLKVGALLDVYVCAMRQDSETEAAAVFQQLEQERGTDTISLGKAVKGYSARAAIMAAQPAVQMAFVRQVVSTNRRRRLPFTDAILAEMVEQIGKMDFITFAPVLETLVRELEKRAEEGVLWSKPRKLPPRVVNG